MTYYLAINGRTEGPYTIEQLKSFHISRSTLVWNQELKDWTPAGNVPELMGCFHEVPPVPPVQPVSGYDANNAFDSGPEGKSRGVAALLAILLGGLGVQYFYLNKIGAGLISIGLTIVTCGLWEIVMLVQGILMFCMTNEQFRNKYVLSPSTFPIF